MCQEAGNITACRETEPPPGEDEGDRLPLGCIRYGRTQLQNEFGNQRNRVLGLG